MNIEDFFLQNPAEKKALVWFLAFIAGGCFFLYVQNRIRRFFLFRRLERGKKKEGLAGDILYKYGYTLRATQKKLKGKVRIGYAYRTYSLVADGLAQKGDKWFLVEVKSGKVAIDPLYKDTRRQLLEYQFFSPFDGLLFLDAENHKVKEIQFQSQAPSRFFSGFIFGLVLGGLLYLALTVVLLDTL